MGNKCSDWLKLCPARKRVAFKLFFSNMPGKVFFFYKTMLQIRVNLPKITLFPDDSRHTGLSGSIQPKSNYTENVHFL